MHILSLFIQFSHFPDAKLNTSIAPANKPAFVRLGVLLDARGDPDKKQTAQPLILLRVDRSER